MRLATGRDRNGPTAAILAGRASAAAWVAIADAASMAVGLGPNRGEGFATSAGPWLVTADEVGDVVEPDGGERFGVPGGTVRRRGGLR